MSFRKKTASQKKKRASKSLFKFLKNRKSVSVALGVCLAVVASAYVVTAKFSADTGASTDKIVYERVKIPLMIKVVSKQTSGKALTKLPIRLGTWGPEVHGMMHQNTVTSKTGLVRLNLSVCYRQSQSKQKEKGYFFCAKTMDTATYDKGDKTLLTKKVDHVYYGLTNKKANNYVQLSQDVVRLPEISARTIDDLKKMKLDDATIIVDESFFSETNTKKILETQERLRKNEEELQKDLDGVKMVVKESECVVTCSYAEITFNNYEEWPTQFKVVEGVDGKYYPTIKGDSIIRSFAFYSKTSGTLLKEIKVQGSYSEKSAGKTIKVKRLK